MITGLAHVNLLVPPGSLETAHGFYADTLGLERTPVPLENREKTAWFNIANGQQIHIAFGANEGNSSRHPCLKVRSLQELQELQQRIYDHHLRGDAAAPKEADKPGSSSGETGVEWPSRFFARDFAGNRLEFSL